MFRSIDPPAFAAPGCHPASTFRSAKTSAAIPVRFGLVWEALVQATLDPAVTTISPTSAPPGSHEADLVDFVVERRRGLRAVAVRPSWPPVVGLPGAVAGTGGLPLPLQVLQECDVHAEPLALNARQAWAHADRWVGAEEQILVLDFLSRETCAPLGDVARLLGLPGGVGKVLALACRGLVDVSIADRSLSPETPVSRRGRS